MVDLNLVAIRLKKDEEVVLKPYVDTVGKTTIGTGRNLTDKGISIEENDYLLHNDIHDALDNLSIYTWFTSLDPVRQLVMVCMMFNLGPTRFAGFSNMLKYMQAHDYVDASIEMLNSKWATQVGQRARDYAQMIKQGILI
jgi:lysozyme